MSSGIYYALLATNGRLIVGLRKAFLVTILSSLQDLLVGCGCSLLPFFRPYRTSCLAGGHFSYHSFDPTGLERGVWVFFATILWSLQVFIEGRGYAMVTVAKGLLGGLHMD